MYGPGQVICDIKNNKPFIIDDIWGKDAYPEKNTHYIDSETGKVWAGTSIEEAKALLAEGKEIIKNKKGEQNI